MSRVKIQTSPSNTKLGCVYYPVCTSIGGKCSSCEHFINGGIRDYYVPVDTSNLINPRSCAYHNVCTSKGSCGGCQHYNGANYFLPSGKNPGKQYCDLYSKCESCTPCSC